MNDKLIIIIDLCTIYIVFDGIRKLSWLEARVRLTIFVRVRVSGIYLYM